MSVYQEKQATKAEKQLLFYAQGLFIVKKKKYGHKTWLHSKHPHIMSCKHVQESFVSCSVIKGVFGRV